MIFRQKNILLKRSRGFIPLLCIFLLYSTDLNGQKEDNVWIMGYTSYTPENPDVNKSMGTIIFDFGNIPPHIYRVEESFLNFKEAVTSMCDKEGELLFCSNGMAVYDRYFQTMDNGDTIAYGSYWEHWNKEKNGVSYPEGFAILQGVLSLPWPGHDEQYLLVYETYNLENGWVDHVYQALIDMKENNGIGKVIIKDVDLIPNQTNGIITGRGKISTCRHANGRDWWIIFPFTEKDKYLIYLLDPQGLGFVREIELENKITASAFGQASFSPDGGSYAMWGGTYLEEPGYIRLYDFDRCEGILTNERSDTLYTGFGNGLSFSPNGAFLYVSNDWNILQYEVHAEDFVSSRNVVADWDFWQDEYGFRYTLGYMALGQDEKIYVIPNNGGSRYLHVIQNPNLKGEDSNVLQHVLKLPTLVGTSRTVPNYPNFRLGPIDGSYCDTLGLDNNPVSRFSFEQDSLDHHSIIFRDLSYFEPYDWTWDFGDGYSSSESDPEHTFQENGVYDVCLTVSNENSSNTNCKIIDIGGVGVGKNRDDIEVSVFPNPVEDVLLVNFTSFIPERCMIVFYDQKGIMVLKERIFYGWNSLNLENLPNGLYYFQILDNKRVLNMGSVVKQ